MFLSLFSIVAYLCATLLLMCFFSKNKKCSFNKTTFLLISFSLIVHALTFSNFWGANGIIFGLANSISFVAWLIATLLFISSLSKPVHALGILIYPLTACALIFNIAFPDTDGKTIPLNIALHVFLSVTAYALLALAACQSVLLRIQEHYLHNKRKINGFIGKLPSLQTMESLLFQNLRVGFYLLTFSLISGFVFIDNLFAQHLAHKTILSVVAWIIFATLIFGRKIFGWRGKQVILSTQIGFVLLLTAYFGSKFVLERLLQI